MADRPLFGTGTPLDQARSVLRSEYGLSAQEVDKLSDEEAANELQQRVLRRHMKARYKATLDELVAAGRLSQARVDEMTVEEAAAMAAAATALSLHHEHAPARAATKPAKQTPQPSEPTAAQMVATLADLVTIVAAQQEEIAQLREQVATLHHGTMVTFGKQAIIDQLSTGDRDYKGFEATIELEESSDLQDEGQSHQEASSHATTGEARDTRAAIEGLASRVAGLNAGRTVNLAEMNQKVVRLSETAKRRAKVKAKGSLRIKIDEVKRSRDPS